MTITPDGALYYNMAENLVAGNGLINQVRKEEIVVPPLFAIILAPFALIFDNPSSYMVFQYILYGLNGVFLTIIGARLFNRRSAGMIAGLLYAIHPVLLLNGPQYLLTETVFISFILTTVYLSIRLFQSEKKTKYFCLLVILLSFSLLFRPHLLYVIMLAVVVWALFWKKGQLSWKSAAIFIAPPVLLLVNGLYNQSLHGAFVPLENYSGQNMYIANNPETEMDFYASTRIEQFVEPEYFEYDHMPLAEKSALLQEKAMNYIIFSPLETVERMMIKMALFFKGIFWLDWLTLFLSAAGIILAFRKGYDKWLLSFLVLYIIGFAALTSLGLLVGGQRYRAPIIPVYLLFAGYLISELFRKIRFSLKGNG